MSDKESDEGVDREGRVGEEEICECLVLKDQVKEGGGVDVVK
jgi:hypothetical protein